MTIGFARESVDERVGLATGEKKWLLVAIYDVSLPFLLQKQKFSIKTRSGLQIIFLFKNEESAEKMTMVKGGYTRYSSRLGDKQEG